VDQDTVASFRWWRCEEMLRRDLMGVLPHAHRLGLLRIGGPIYQFRHAELQRSPLCPTTAPTEQALQKHSSLHIASAVGAALDGPSLAP
jgi:hypothetical protein